MGELCSLPIVLFPRQIRGITVGADDNYCTIVLGRPLVTDQRIRICTFPFKSCLNIKVLGGKSYLYLFNVSLLN
jgi:hypothetical protein